MAGHLNLVLYPRKPAYLVDFMVKIRDFLYTVKQFDETVTAQGPEGHMTFKRLPDGYAENGWVAYTVLPAHVPKRIRDKWGMFEVHVHPDGAEKGLLTFSVM